MGAVICGIDNTDHGREAATVAAELGRWLASPVTLVHAISRRGGPTRSHVEPEAALRTADEALGEMAARLGEHVTSLVVEGDPRQALVKHVERTHADWLVVGSADRGVVASAVLGSVASHLARHAPCPVVLVPAGCQAPAVRIADGGCVIAGMLDQDGAVGTVAARLAQALGCPALLVHVLGSEEHAAVPRMAGPVPLAVNEHRAARRRAAQTMLGHARDDAQRHAEAVMLVDVIDGSPAAALRGLADDEAAAAIVVGSRGRGALRSALLGSVSRDLARHAPCPVVVCAQDTGPGRNDK